jgi:hypothetical protein
MIRKTNPEHVARFDRAKVRFSVLMVLLVASVSIGGRGTAVASGYGAGTPTFVYFNEMANLSSNSGYFYRVVAGTTWVGTFTTGPSSYMGGNLTFVGTYTETMIGVGAKPECLGNIVLKRHITNLASVMLMSLTVTADGGIPCTSPIGTVSTFNATESVPQPIGLNYTPTKMRTIVQAYVAGGPALPKLVWPKWTVVASAGAQCRDLSGATLVSTLPAGTDFTVTQAVSGPSRLKTSAGCYVKAKTSLVKPYLLPF